jgi:hypothetical protein
MPRIVFAKGCRLGGRTILSSRHVRERTGGGSQSRRPFGTRCFCSCGCRLSAHVRVANSRNPLMRRDADFSDMLHCLKGFARGIGTAGQSLSIPKRTRPVPWTVIVLSEGKERPPLFPQHTDNQSAPHTDFMPASS